MPDQRGLSSVAAAAAAAAAAELVQFSSFHLSCPAVLAQSLDLSCLCPVSKSRLLC